MTRSLKALLTLICLVASVSTTALARYVYVFPSPSANGPLLIYTADPFVQIAAVNTLPDASYAFSNIEGTRTYIIGRGGNVAVLDATKQFTEVVRYGLGANVLAATLSADGRKLLVAAGTFRVIPLYTNDGSPLDFPQSIPNVQAIVLPDDVASAHDSSVAIVTSSSSRTITLVDLNSYSVSAQQTLSQSPNGVSVAPNGLAYVAATGRLYEIDIRSGLNFLNPGGFQFDADAGKPSFTPDGNIAVLFNRTSGAAAGIVAVNLTDRTISTAYQGAGVQLERPLMVNASTGYALSSGRLYSFTVTPAAVPQLSPLGLPEGQIAIAISNETTNPRFLWTTIQNAAYRVALQGGGQIGPLTFSAAAGGIGFNGGGTVGPVAQVRNQTLDLQMTAGSVSLPLSVRAVDTAGRPVPGVVITYSSSAAGMTFAQPTARTNIDGLAEARATLPPNPGNFIIRAQAAGGQAVEFTVRVIASTGGGGSVRFAVTAGNGQIIAAGGVSQPFQVQLRNALGDAIQGATVSWAIKAGTGVALIGAAGTTDSNGFAVAQLTTTTFTPIQVEQFRAVTISAAVDIPGFTGAVDMQSVIYPNLSQPPVVNLTALPANSTGELILPAGGVVLNAFRATILTGLSGLTPVPLPNVGMRTFTAGGAAQTASCRDNPVSNAAGVVICDLIVGSALGSTTMTLVIGESPLYTYTYTIRVIPGAPAKMTILAGDGQSGAPGTVSPRTLVVQVFDAANNLLPGVTVNWSIVSGDGQLTGIIPVTDLEGRSGAQVRFGTTPGAIVVRAATEGLTQTFNAFNDVPVGSFTIVSGNNQTTSPGIPFGTPLTVKLLNPQGAPIAGAAISFAVLSGPVTLSGSNITTNTQGEATVTATAGATQGPAQVRASIGSSNVLTFSLTVGPAGPRVTAVVNGAGFQAGASACSVATIRGTGFTSSLTGVQSAPMTGPLPLTLGGVSVRFANSQAPIFAVANISGQEQINVQVPCEVSAGQQQLVVTAGGQASDGFTVTVADVQPGIFTFTNSANNGQAVAIHSNGTYVTPESPALLGETVTAFFTGLGGTNEARATNALGTGQTVPNDRIIIGVNSQGMPVIAAQYAPNLIGVYTVRFTVDPIAGTGNALAFAIGVVNSSGQTVYGNPTTLPVRAQ